MSKCQTLSVEEAARILGVGRGTAYDAVRTGELPHVRVGRRIVVPRHALNALLGMNEAPNGHGPADEGPKRNGASYEPAPRKKEFITHEQPTTTREGS
jgi:excisionase family DNA binding protein